MRAHPEFQYSLFVRDCGAGLRADVRLGSPRFSDCRGVGICAILLDGLPDAGFTCRDWCEARLTIDAPTGRLLLHFLRSTISERTYDHHFGSGYLKVQEAYRLPKVVADSLQLDETHASILPGRYPVLETDDLLLVSCRLHGAEVRTLSVPARAA